ncbi:MAG: NnrU family protein [Pseudomonadota bacterium]
MSWLELCAAFVFFFLSHTIPVRPVIKERLIERVGKTSFLLLYSGVSLVALAWIISAAGRAPYVEIWSWQPWHSWITVGLMLSACVLVCLVIGKPNPFSFGGRNNASFDVNKPGLFRFLRHPLLVALALWSGSHTLANGDLAHVLVFGTFTCFTILGQWIIDRRKKRELGARWVELVAQSRKAEFSIYSGSFIDTITRILIGLLLFLCTFFLHEVLIGVPPLPL